MARLRFFRSAKFFRRFRSSRLALGLIAARVVVIIQNGLAIERALSGAEITPTRSLIKINMMMNVDGISTITLTHLHAVVSTRVGALGACY